MSRARLRFSRLSHGVGRQAAGVSQWTPSTEFVQPGRKGAQQAGAWCLVHQASTPARRATPAEAPPEQATKQASQAALQGLHCAAAWTEPRHGRRVAWPDLPSCTTTRVSQPTVNNSIEPLDLILYASPAIRLDFDRFTLPAYVYFVRAIRVRATDPLTTVRTNDTGVTSSCQSAARTISSRQWL